ncbi:glutamate receptor 1.4-like [Bidens hawaiensis]|uniref:glutamate receptor 1.4-like n=1 Tax=Bidens hawaiensis TaxID=980011 RepID=UPI004049D52E
MMILLMLSFQTLLPAQEVLSHKEMQVGVILNMDSGVGKLIYHCIFIAISDFYQANPHYITRIVFNMRDTKLTALSSALELLENTKVQAIIGPDPTVEARFLEVLEEKANVPILSFSTSLFSNPNPYLVQIAQEETTQIKAIAEMIELYELTSIVLICEDTTDGRQMAAYIITAFQDKNIHVAYTSQIPTVASDEQIREEFLKFQHMQATTFVMHARPSLATNIFSRAKEVGMMDEGYVWIITDKMANFLNFMNDDAIESIQGVVGFKSYFPKSRELHKFIPKWINEYYGILAYDVVYALAMAFEKVHTKFIGASLINIMLNTRTASNALEVVNVIGKGDRMVGFWMLTGEFVKEIGKTNSSSNNGLEDIIFPGGTTSILKRRRLQMKGKKLRIIVPGFGVFPNLIKMAVDHRTNQPTLSGFCGDVFNAALNALNSGVEPEFTQYPYEEGRAYSDLIDKVYFKEFDAAIGDITITWNRSLYVDFTMPFSDTGVGTITRNSKRSIWIFLDPLSSDLWLTSGGFFLILAFVIWFIEHHINEEFQGSTLEQVGTALWFAFSTLAFAHREKLKSNLSRFMVMVWVFVVLVLTSSYTGTLSSLLTVQEIASNGGMAQLPSISYELLNRSAKLKSPADYAKVLRSGEAGAVIDEILYVKTFISLYPADEFSLVAASTSTITNGFAFVFQKDSTLTRKMSVEIAKLREDGTLKALEDKWLKQPSSLISNDISAPSRNNLDLYGFRGLFLTSALSMALALLGSMIYLYSEKWNGKSKMEILRSILRRSDVMQSQESVREPTL